MAALQSDLENTRSQLECEHTLKTQRLEQVFLKRVHDLNSLNDDLKAEIDKLEVQVRWLRTVEWCHLSHLGSWNVSTGVYMHACVGKLT